MGRKLEEGRGDNGEGKMEEVAKAVKKGRGNSMAKVDA